MNVVEIITPIDQYVIEHVRKLRSDKKQTQQNIADILQVSRSFVKDVENTNNRAKYNLSHINALADYFNLSPAEFLPSKAIPDDKSKDDRVIKKSSKLNRPKRPTKNNKR